MKRLICLLLVLCLILAGCGKKEAEVPTEPSTEPPTTEAAEPPTTEATEPPATEATEPETEPTEPSLPMINPLTGEALEDYYTGRPVAFTINNISAALPQYGLNELDWMFEVETEGGITRCVGIIADPSEVGTLGPIRSARSYFLNLSVSYNAPLFHCGASQFVVNNWYGFEQTVSSWDHVNQMTSGSKYFYRDSRGGGYATEHTLFTSGDRLAAAMEELGFNPTGNEPVSYGYQFSDEVILDGQTADTVTFRFKGGKRTTMEYDSEANMYLAHQNGSDWIDGSTREHAAFRNVLIISAEQSMYNGGQYIHSFYELSGSGDGWFAVDGQIVPIKWYHEGVEGPFSFTLEDGTPITLGVGSTYCAIIDDDCTVTAE